MQPGCALGSTTAGQAGHVPLTLKHLLSALLASAAEQGIDKIEIDTFFSILAELLRKDEYKSVAPPLAFRQTGKLYYSKRVDEALQSLVGYFVQIPNPTMQRLQVPQSLATLQLQWLREKYPDQPWAQLAKAFVGELGKRAKRPI
jgi:hypothetical protein